MKKLKTLNKILNWYIGIGIAILFMATILILSPLYPYLWFQLNNDALASEQTNVVNLVTMLPDKPVNNDKPQLDLPIKDPLLPKDNKFVIPSIGVFGVINENQIPGKGLEKGIWRVTDWGDPIHNENSIIIASHRFGYLAWNRDFRTKNSFENLPKTKIGDTVEILWNQRRFVYQIYKTQEGVKITDYNADLIIYTCKTLNSDVRIFRYAKRVE